MTSKVNYQFVEHKGEKRIVLQFDYNAAVIKRLKEIASPKWSQSLKAWHVADTGEMRTLFKLEPKAKLTNEVLTKENSPTFSPKKQECANQVIYKKHKIHTVNKNVLPALEQMLTLKGYSANSKRTYMNEVAAFLQAIKANEANTFPLERIKKYIAFCLKEGIKENTVHSRLNALKFYYEQVLGRENFFVSLPRPKKPQKLPKVISEERILKCILGLENLKHKALLITAYSAGLRVSEVVSLKITDVNNERMQLLVENSKGKKDRVVPLAKVTLAILREYYKIYKPKIWLFEGQNTNEPYNTRSAQIVFKAIAKKMELPPNISFHSLRHSFATHLLENGTDITYIQKLLGHNDIKTTLIYANVSNKDISKIESPIDKIWRKNGL